MKICHYNINSVLKYKQELLITFPEVDIFSLNETRLPTPTAHLSFPGYTIYRQDRKDKAGGGVLLALHNTLQSNHVFSGTIEHNEIVIIELKMKNNERLLLASVYCPPQFPLSKKALDKIVGLHHRHLILGDLNAKHIELGGRSTNKSGRILDEWLIDNHLEIIGGALPTFEKGSCREKLDWVFSVTQTSLLAHSYAVHPQLGDTQSGHLPLTFELPLKPDNRELECARKQFVFEKANWKLYKSALNQRLRQKPAQEVDTIDDLIAYNTFVTKCIVDATELAVRKPSQFKRKQTILPSAVTLRLIKEKHCLYRRMKRDTDNNSIRTEFNRSRLLVRNSLANDTTASFKQLLNTLSAPKINSQRIWSTVNRFQGKRATREIKHEVKLHGETARFDNEKVELFRRYFQEMYERQPHTFPDHIATDESVEAFVEDNRQDSKQDYPRISDKELKSVLDNFGNTAVGHDGVHNKCLKRHTKLLVAHLLALYNSSFALGHVPTAWKLAYIVLIHKPDKGPQEVG